MEPENTGVLFITWDGPQSAYLEGLFLPIFVRLREEGYRFHVLQFTWGDGQSQLKSKAYAEKVGIGYTSIKIFRRPLLAGSVVTAVWGAYVVWRLARQHRFDILMPRSILPALTVLIAKRWLPKLRVLFDADGLPVDERIDFAGASPDGLSSRIMRDSEALAVRRADGVLTRSQAASRILLARGGAGTRSAKFFRVPNSRDEMHFRPITSIERQKIRGALGVPDSSPVIVYAGSSLTGKYLGRQMVDFFLRVLQLAPDAHLLILTTAQAEAEELLRCADQRVSTQSRVMRVPYEEVPLYIGSADLGLALIEPKFSMVAAAAIKVGEYLLCGIPVLMTKGIGDSDDLLADGIGLALNDTSPAQLDAAANWFISRVAIRTPEAVTRIRDVGRSSFSFESGIAEYRNALGFAATSTASEQANPQ